MIGRSGFHGLLRNVRVSPWTRRSLTESLLLNRSGSEPANEKARKSSGKQPSPSAMLTIRAWKASISARLHKDKAG